MVRVIVLDFDMTLVDSLPYLRKGTMANLSRLKLRWPDVPESELLGYTPEKFARAVVNCNDPCPYSWQEILAGHNASIREQVDSLEIKSIPTLQQIQAGGVRLAILSNSPHYLIKQTVDKSNVGFDLILACDDVGLNHSKVERLNECLTFFNCRGHELMYVGDHPNDITSAQKAGVLSAGIATELHDKEDLMVFRPDFLIDSLDELADLIGSV